MADMKPNEYVQRGQQYNRPHRTGQNNNNPNNYNFEKGLHEGDNKIDKPFPMQPTPFEVKSNLNAATPGSASNPEEESATPQADSVAIGKDQVRKGMEILRKYKKGKQNLEDKICRNEKWWKMRHWDLLQNENNIDDPKPASGWLFNTIISKHADYMDSFPTVDILPREEGDVEEAERLSSIIPVVMEQNEYRNVYSDEAWYKLKHGTGVYGIFWDGSKLNGLGDISIKCMDLLSLYWQPGVTDIQKSENFFSVELVSNHVLEEQYPQCKGELSKTQDSIVKKYWYDEAIDTTGMSAVIDWYYHKHINGKKTLQYIKFVDDIVLYATENEPSMRERGLYDHAMYPFVFDRLFPDAGMPTGFGFVDVCKNSQTSIDIYNNAFEKNVQFACTPRYLSRNDGGINEEEFMNPSKMIIHVDGNVSNDTYAPVSAPTFVNGNYIGILDQKINEMKETAGNRDTTTGGTQSGVTAASAIAAMQESAGKTSRDQIASTYDSHKKVVNIVIELIRQFYDMPRQFRIVGQDGSQEFTEYSNQGLLPQYLGNDFGTDMGYRLPVFDVTTKAEKENAYTQMSQNEMALQFYNLGFFNPQYADQALACIDMMEFQGKSGVISKIQQNGGMYQQMVSMQQQMLKLSEMVDQLTGGTMGVADATADSINGQMDSMTDTPNGNGKVTLGNGESSITANAREKANAVTSPR